MEEVLLVEGRSKPENGLSPILNGVALFLKRVLLDLCLLVDKQVVMVARDIFQQFGLLIQL